MMSEVIGVLIIGVKGAVATTLISAGLTSSAGLVKQFTLPSEMDPLFQQLDLPTLDMMRFGGWDVASASMKDSLQHHGVVPKTLVDQIDTQLNQVWLSPGVALTPAPIHDELDPKLRIASQFENLRVLVDMLRADIQTFKTEHQADRVVVLDLSSTAPNLASTPCHHSLAEFEQVLDLPVQNALSLNTVHEGMLYAYAAISEGCSCINFTPSKTFDIPALIELAVHNGVPLCGKDGKTGQTLYKTAIAPLLRQRALKVKGWYSTNILGNRDGEVLDHPEHRQTKIDSKRAVLSEILGYDDFDHQVHIHYYKPRGDAKEAWDNIDFEGWFGVPMQMKINWLGSDSILAAPLAVDLVRWMIYFQRRGETGVISSLSSYFKSPIAADTHDFFEQVLHLREEIKKHLKVD
jgi:myo-inositol-1-phosphate synthase